jgi:hypothetical protein
VTKLWSVLEGLCLLRTKGYEKAELHIDFKIVVQNLFSGQPPGCFGYMLICIGKFFDIFYPKKLSKNKKKTTKELELKRKHKNYNP